MTTLYSFGAGGPVDEGGPYDGLIQAPDGNFYGTTGGSLCTSVNCGTIFKITPDGNFTNLYTFCAQAGCSDGATPTAGLIQATDGNLYGTTTVGGAGNQGTVFEITTASQLTTLYNFCTQQDCPDGKSPFGGLLQATDGNFYGTTYQGGSNFSGTVFKVSTGLGPFVRATPNSGKVGAKVSILGTNLNGATSLSFNGTAASFTVVSSSQITTKVPAGATTGTVTVTTPGNGTLNSNVAFRVTPQIKSFSPTSGPVGTQVKIKGVSLTQTSAVTFGGVAATQVVVNSDKQLTATVPQGALTGPIAITTPGGTTASAASFTVTP